MPLRAMNVMVPASVMGMVAVEFGGGEVSCYSLRFLCGYPLAAVR